jgi:hypothetical protein
MTRKIFGFVWSETINVKMGHNQKGSGSSTENSALLEGPRKTGRCTIDPAEVFVFGVTTSCPRQPTHALAFIKLYKLFKISLT